MKLQELLREEDDDLDKMLTKHPKLDINKIFKNLFIPLSSTAEMMELPMDVEIPKEKKDLEALLKKLIEKGVPWVQPYIAAWALGAKKMSDVLIEIHDDETGEMTPWDFVDLHNADDDESEGHGFTEQQIDAGRQFIAWVDDQDFSTTERVGSFGVFHGPNIVRISQPHASSQFFVLK